VSSKILADVRTVYTTMLQNSILNVINETCKV